MLENTPIYFPLYLFFYNKPVYIKNQQVSFRLKKKKECTKIELVYDILTYEEPNFNELFDNREKLILFLTGEYNQQKEKVRNLLNLLKKLIIFLCN